MTHVLIITVITVVGVALGAAIIACAVVIRRRIRKIDGHVSDMQGMLDRIEAPYELPGNRVS